MSAEKTLAINDVLKRAQCTHIFDTDRDPVCEVIACEDVREWNAIEKATVAVEENHKRFSDLFLDKDFYTTISQTIANLESLTSTAINQRLKLKRLHIHHAALTLCTKDLSHLLLAKPGELPKPEHTITDPVTNLDRPCKSIEETQQSTQERTQAYMSSPAVLKECLFGAVTSDTVGPSGLRLTNVL